MWRLAGQNLRSIQIHDPSANPLPDAAARVRAKTAGIGKIAAWRNDAAGINLSLNNEGLTAADITQDRDVERIERIGTIVKAPGSAIDCDIEDKPLSRRASHQFLRLKLHVRAKS